MFIWFSQIIKILEIYRDIDTGKESTENVAENLIRADKIGDELYL